MKIKKENTEIIGISIGSYPYGTARSIRNMTLLKGLNEKGFNTELKVLYSEKNQDLLSNKRIGSYKGVEFQYLSKIKYNSNKLIRLYHIINNSLSFIKTIKYKAKTGNKIIIFNFITHPLITSLITLPLSKKKNVTIFHEIINKKVCLKTKYS